MFKKSLEYGQAGDNVGVLLRGTKRDDVRRGQVRPYFPSTGVRSCHSSSILHRSQVLAAPGSVKTYKKFEAEIYVLTDKEGGGVLTFFSLS